MKDYVKVNRDAYDNTAEEYLKRAGNSTEPLDTLAGKPLSFLKKQSRNRILEIGPGSGEICRYYDNLGNQTTAIDVSEKIIGNVQKISPKTKCIVGDMLEIDIGVDAFDLVYAGALIHLFTIEDAHLVMKKIIEALHVEGILFINTTIHPESSEGYIEKIDYLNSVKRYRHQYTLSEFRILIENNQLQIIDSMNTVEDDRGKYWQAFICKKIL